MMIIIYITNLKHISCRTFKEMDESRIMRFHQPSYHSFWWPPYPKKPHNFTSYASKDSYGCRNDYIEAFGAVYWAKKPFKNLRGVVTTPFRRTRVNLFFFFQFSQIWGVSLTTLVTITDMGCQSNPFAIITNMGCQSNAPCNCNINGCHCNSFSIITDMRCRLISVKLSQI